MANITVLLLVLTLTGMPVVSAICPVACEPASARQHDCHEDMATGGRAVMAVGADFCIGPMPDSNPYLVEHRANVGAAVPADPSFTTTASAAWTHAPTAATRSRLMPAAPPLVLRL